MPTHGKKTQAKRINEQVTLTLPPHARAILRTMAEANELSLSAMITVLIHEEARRRAINTSTDQSTGQKTA